MDAGRLATLLSAFLLSLASASIFDNARNKKCQPIEISLCKDIPYNETFYPNILGHTDQQSLNVQTEHFKPLIHTNCSPHIKFFVCSVFAPMCPEAFPQPVTSCREVCLQVKRDCEAILDGFGIGWPELLNCSKFPQAPELCMKPTDPKESWASNGPTGNVPFDPPRMPGDDIFPNYPPVKCPDDMIDLDPTDPMGACGIPCSKDVMFDEQNKRFAEHWMLIWAAICLVVTAFTVATFLFDRSRFRFPERSIIYLAACYHLYSWVYIARVLFLSYEQSACERLRSGTSYLTAGGLDNPKCVLTFMVLYYFSLASSLWWVILTFTWYLSAGRKWVPEGIEAWSSYFHFVAWGTPALLSIAVLIMHKVDASELTGICFVGNSDPLALWGFVIGPRIFFVLIGGCFLIAGFASICTVRDSLRHQGTDTSKLEKLMVKIGIFSVLYVIPAALTIACDSYHALLLGEWQAATTACKASGGAGDIACRRPKTKPQVEVYMLNIFMSLIVGTTAGMWVGSRKTCATWQKILCCGLLSPPGAKYPSGTYPGAACKPLMTPAAAALTGSRASGHSQGTAPSYQMTMLPQPHPHPQSTSTYSNYRRNYQPWGQPVTAASSETSKAI